MERPSFTKEEIYGIETADYLKELTEAYITVQLKLDLKLLEKMEEIVGEWYRKDDFSKYSKEEMEDLLDLIHIKKSSKSKKLRDWQKHFDKIDND